MRRFRGTYDKLVPLAEQHRYIVDIALALSRKYGFSEIDTPIFEYKEVFTKTLGAASDIVHKEMFVFKDRHDDDLVLRPEGTAGIMRAVLSNGLYQSQPLQYIYAGPMFRYERPQKGRYRQFHQIGVECIGDSSALRCAEIIEMAWQFLHALSLKGTYTLEINSLGNTVSRQKYVDALRQFLQGKSLSEDSIRRLEANPLRILDSKDSRDKQALKGAPSLDDFWESEDRSLFSEVTSLLTLVGIPYVHNPHLVRGLDYYNGITFEITTEALGAQGTVLAGGQYDSLSRSMGGPNLSAIGWAAGIERLAELQIYKSQNPYMCAFIALGSEQEHSVYALAYDARKSGIPCITMKGNSLRSLLKKADKSGCSLVCLMGSEEKRQNNIVLRELITGAQETIPCANIMERLQEHYESYRKIK